MNLFKLLTNCSRYLLYGFVLLLAACDVTEEPLNSNYEIRLEPLQVRVGDESSIRKGDKFALAIYNQDTGLKDFSAALSSDNQSFQADEYTWTLSDPSVASLESEQGYENVITILKPVTFTIDAINSQNKTSITIESIDPLLQQVDIEANNEQIILGNGIELTLFGTFSDDSQSQLLEGIGWSVDDESVAQIDATGKISSLSKGQVVVSAKINNGIGEQLLATKTIEVTPAAIVSLEITGTASTPLGRQIVMQATATFTDNTKIDRSSLVQWEHNSPAIGTFDEFGNFQTTQVGTTAITASIDNGYGSSITAASFSLNVEEKVVDGLTIKPINDTLKTEPLTIAIDKTEFFVVEALYSNLDVADITTDETLVFSSSQSDIATASYDQESEKFQVDTFEVGTVDLTVVKMNRSETQITGTLPLVVNKPLLLSIDVEPVIERYALGLISTWRAMGNFQNNIREDITELVTWNSSSETIASFNSSNPNELIASSVGDTLITASLVNDIGENIISTGFAVSTTSALLTQITIEATDENVWQNELLSIPKGVRTPVRVVGLYTDGTQRDETNVVWTSSNNSLVSIVAVDGFFIEANSTANALGTLTVSATVEGDAGIVSDEINVNVVPAKLDSFSIVLPEEKGLWQGYTQSIQAIGNFSDGVARNISDYVSWSIAPEFESFIGFNSALANTLDLILQGDATLNATFIDVNYNNVETNQNIAFSISPPLLETIEIESYYDSNKDGIGDELISQLAKGQSGVFKAIGHYSDGSTQDISSKVTWDTSDGNVLSIVEAGSGAGRVFAANSSEADVVVTASITNADNIVISQPLNFPVTIAVLESINLVPAALSYGVNVPSGESVQIDIWGIYSDGGYKQIEDVSAAQWQSSNIEVAEVNPTTGFVEILPGEGSVVTISATEVISGKGHSATILLNRIETVFTSIRIEPNTSDTPWIVSLGSQFQFKAFAVYADTTEKEITKEVTTNWSIPNTDEHEVAIINNSDLKGLVTGLTQGDDIVTLTVSSSNRYGDQIFSSAEIIVGAPILELIEVAPTNTKMVAGDTITFEATGYTSDDRFLELTDTVTWSSSNTAIADFNQTNASDLYAKFAGEIEVFAKYTPPGQEEISTTTRVSISAATLRSIEITPTFERFTVSPQPEALFLKGVPDLLIATGIYSNESRSGLNGEVSWSSSNPSVATVDVVGILTPIEEGETVITAELVIDELGESKTIYVDYPIVVGGPLLEYLELSPLSPTTIINLPLQFTAMGFYSDGSSTDLTEEVTWQVGRPGDDVALLIGSMTSGTELGGRFVANKNGFGPISARINNFDGVEISKQTFITVSALTEINITNVRETVYAGQTEEFTAIGKAENGKSIVFTEGLNWHVSGAGGVLIESDENTSVAQVKTASAGLLSVSVDWTLDDNNPISGDIDVSVTSPLLNAISIEVDQTSVPDGRTAQLSATGTYSDNSTLDLTEHVAWTTSNSSLADPASDGTISTFDLGEVKIAASITNAESELLSSNVLDFTIGDAVLDTLSLNYPDSEIARGSVIKMVPTGTMTDGTTDLPTTVTWQSSDTSVATVDNGGAVLVLSTANIGSFATISAKAKESFSSSVDVTATSVITVGNPVLASLAINSIGGSVARGTSSTLTTVGLLTDDTLGLPTPLTWTSSNPAVMSIDAATGVVTVPDSAQIGDVATISVSAPSFIGSSNIISNSTVLSVSAPLVENLSITNGDIGVARGTAITMVPASVMSDSSSAPILSWSTSNADIAVISNTGTLEIPNGATLGSTARITVSAPKTTNSSVLVTDSILVTVLPPVLDTLTISSSSSSVPRGTDISLSVSGMLSDNGLGIPTTLEWSSSNTSVATVSSVGVVSTTNTAAIGSTVTITARAKKEATSSTYIVDQYELTIAAPLLDTIDIVQPDSELGLGLSLQLTITGLLSDGTSDSPSGVIWSSSNTDTATVDSNGVVSVLNATTVGSQALITAKAEINPGSGVYTSSSMTITVINAALETISLSATNTTVPVGTTQQVVAVGSLSNGTNGILTSQIWSSSDTDTATVNSSGLVTFKPSATAGDTVDIELRALAQAGSSTYISGNITLTVGDPILSGIEITTSPPTISRGTTLSITAVGTLTNNNNGLPTPLTWSSSNTDVATVDTNGVVTIKASASVGSQAAITVSAAVTAGSSVTVRDTLTVTAGQARLQSLTLSATEMDVPVGTSQQISVAALLSDGSTTLSTSQV
ncbi:Ig-like domain-containing protein, partial [Psychrosphaera sp. I2R16]